VLKNQFSGMTAEDFTYDDYEFTRKALVRIMLESLTKEDKAFLMSVKNLAPDWSVYDFERFPAVQWKLQNLQKLKTNNPEKHRTQYEALKDMLGG
jgi:hypothetical protein